MPRRSGKDITALNYVIRQMWANPGVYYYIFPTYSQAKKVIWDSMTNDGKRILDYFPKELVIQMNSQEMKIRMTAKDGKTSLFQLVGSDNVDCFDDKTEILTQNGWKLFKDLSPQETVATLNPDTSYFEWQQTTRKVEYDFEGDLLAIKNKSTDFSVTPNHRFFVKSTKGKYKFREISDPSIRHDTIPSTCLYKGNHVDTILGYNSYVFMKFLGFFLSEGCTFQNKKCNRVTISQIKSCVREEIKLFLNEMGLNYCEHKSGFNIENKKLFEYCSQFGLCDKKFIPTDILNLSKEHLSILFDYLMLGDGHRSGSRVVYYSTSKRLIDNVQEIIIKIGYSGNIREIKQTPSFIRGRKIFPKKNLYSVRVRFSKFKRLTGSSQKPYIHKKHYSGKVYCVSVPNQVIKVRRNGSEMWSGNSLMGTNPRGCVFSEYALQDPIAYQYMRPILTANGGWALFISTPRGKSHLWDLYQLAEKSPYWFSYKLTVEDTKHIPMEKIEKEKEDGLMSEDMIQQEYWCSFEMGIEGSYYNKYLDKCRLNGQIGDVPWESAFKVHTAWDIGVRDKTSIIFFQTIGQTVRIIDSYENSKHGIEHYAEVLSSKPYLYGTHIAPHDIRVREWGSGITRFEKARQLGIQFTIADNLGISDGIEACRSLFSKLWIDETKCSDLINAIENYRQEYDARKKVYMPRPLHDWASDFCDSLRMLAISLPKTSDSLSAEEIETTYQEATYGTDQKLPAFYKNDNTLGKY